MVVAQMSAPRKELDIPAEALTDHLFEEGGRLMGILYPIVPTGEYSPTTEMSWSGGAA